MGKEIEVVKSSTRTEKVFIPKDYDLEGHCEACVKECGKSTGRYATEEKDKGNECCENLEEYAWDPSFQPWNRSTGQKWQHECKALKGNHECFGACRRLLSDPKTP